MSTVAEQLSPPFQLSALADGCGYRVPRLSLSQPNLFTRLGSLDDLIVKIPSDRGSGDFTKYVKEEQTDPQDIRRNEEVERFRNLDQAIEQYPAFGSTRESFGDDYAHFLLVHRIQHARLEAAQLVAVPKTRFVVLQWPRWLFGSRSSPAIVQEKISGTSLIDMVEPMEGVFLRRYEPLRPKVKSQLQPLVDSALRIHIDWNIANFVWQDRSERLFYVDSKPSTLASKFSVEHNLSSVREVFLA